MRNIKKERIIRILLSKKPLTKYRIAKMAECTPSWVYMFLKQIKNKNLYDLWLKIKKKPKYREYLIKEPLKILKETKLDYALTTYFAETITQSYLFPLRYDIYIKEEDLNKWHKVLTDNGFYGKGNFRTLIYDDFKFLEKQIINFKNIKLKVVTEPQLIVDLIQENGPAKEAAEMLMKNV
tara:strand:- start:494 stop:1033 length:540 start_codon:yes stop_codon:yes gene_type:complete